jgi:hypothetical protein
MGNLEFEQLRMDHLNTPRDGFGREGHGENRTGYQAGSLGIQEIPV